MRHPSLVLSPQAPLIVKHYAISGDVSLQPSQNLSQVEKKKGLHCPEMELSDTSSTHVWALKPGDMEWLDECVLTI